MSGRYLSLRSFREHPTPLRAIRLFCIDCMGGTQKGPAKCNAVGCPLWTFRMGMKRNAKKKTGKKSCEKKD